MRVRAVLLAAILVLGLTLDGSSAPASPHADFRAGIEYSDRGRDSRSCGSAASSGAGARMDVDLGRVGVFTLLVDMEGRRMSVLSQKD